MLSSRPRSICAARIEPPFACKVCRVARDDASRANARPALVEKNSRTDDTSANTDPSCRVSAVSVRSTTSFGIRDDVGIDLAAAVQPGDLQQHRRRRRHPRLGGLGIDHARRAFQHHLERPRQQLGPLERPPRPEQRFGGTGRDRRDQVDLRQRLADDAATAAPPCRRPPRHPSLSPRSGRSGSSPGARTLAPAPCITSMRRSVATSCRRTTTARMHDLFCRRGRVSSRTRSSDRASALNRGSGGSEPPRR